MTPLVTDIIFHRGSRRELRAGLIGYLSFLLDGHTRVDGVTVREATDGRRVLSFPAKRRPDGREYALVRPIDDAAREAIEEQVLGAIGVGAWRP